MKFFFKSLYLSITHFEWMKDNRKDFKNALGYFFIFLLIVSALTLARITWVLPEVLQEAQTTLTEKFPDFTAKIHDGKLSTENIQEPFIFTLHEEGGDFKIVINSQSENTRIDEVIDTSKESGILFTKTTLSVHDHTNMQTKTQSLTTFPNMEFSKSALSQKIKKLQEPTRVIGITLLTILLYFVFLCIGKLAYIALMSIPIYIATQVMKKKWKYSHIFTVGLFAITIPTIIQHVLIAINFPIPFIYTIAFLAYILFPIFYLPDEVHHET